MTENKLYEEPPQGYHWRAIILSKKTVKKIQRGYLIRVPQSGLYGWSSYSVITNVFEDGDIQSTSNFFEAGRLVQVARPHQRSK